MWFILLLITIICVSIIVVISMKSTGKSTKEQLLIADKYLDELEYDKAIATYNSVIAIDPKCTEAYLGIADAYEAKGEPVLAAKALALSYNKVAQKDRSQIEAKHAQLVNTYPEVQEAMNTGTIELGPDYDADIFNSFFQLDEAVTNSENNRNQANSDTFDSEAMAAWEDDSLLSQFTLMGRPLGDWKFDELESYIRSNFSAQPEYDNNGYIIRDDRQYNYIDESGMNYIFAIIENGTPEHPDINTIQLDTNGVTYVTSSTSDVYRYWNVYSYEGNSGDDDAYNIVLKPFDKYLESICPGAYEQLQSKNDITVNGVHIVKDEDTVYLYKSNGYICLHIKDNIIYSFGIQFYDTWEITTNTSHSSLSNNNAFPEQSQEYDNGLPWVAGVNWDWTPYTLFNRPIADWTEETLLNHIRSSYPCSYSDELSEVYVISSNGQLEGEMHGEIYIDFSASDYTYVSINTYSGIILSLTFDPYMITYSFSFVENNGFPNVDLGIGYISEMFNMTLAQYLESASPQLYIELQTKDYVTFDFGSVSQSESGLFINADFTNMDLYTDFETGKITNIYFTKQLQQY